MLDFLGVNFLAIIYNLCLLTTKIMIGDKQKKSHRNIVFFIHQNSDISECWIHVPQVNFVGEFGIHDFWRVRFGSQFSFGGKHSLYVFGFHFIHTSNWVGVKGGLFLEFHYTFMSESQIFSQFQTRFTCPPTNLSYGFIQCLLRLPILGITIPV